MKPALLVSAVLAALLLTQCAVPAGGGGGDGPLPPATKENPFVNSLGMKFVPVPGTNILMCTTETTVAQYQAAGMGHSKSKFPAGPSHPAVNVSWFDAKAWCKWLSRIEGRKYRLPTFAEWSAAVGGDTYPWGNQWPPKNNSGNYAGQELRGSSISERAILDDYPKAFFNLITGFRDLHKFTSPVGSYPSNRHGLHDLGGNVSEWCEDELPTFPFKDTRIRGASWRTSHEGFARSDYFWRVRVLYNDDFGFRCVVGL